MIQIEQVVVDRGSRYAVSGGPANTRAEAEAFVKSLKRKKKYAKATHNSWAVILPDGEWVKADDGEGGAGQVILRSLDGAGVSGEVVVVTRWYGGTHLGGDRFRHVATCVRTYLDARAAAR